ncbi:DUF305 domain-containing protein [Streptomyces sp. NPDC005811]|uniref:DUF305 domain-containing protein n=1 Tax=Streptomyces sp. NPDC005811 TaxID=3154565 RepID=UPI00340E60C6
MWWRTAEGTARASTPGTTSAEAGFSHDMAVHHQQAVEMSFIVRDRADDEEVRTLVYDVIKGAGRDTAEMDGSAPLGGVTGASGR